MTRKNRQILLASRPQGEPTAQNFQLVEEELPELKAGEVQVQHHFLSLDPYMRGRMNEAKSYAAPQPLGKVMLGGTVGQVVESKSDYFKPGDTVLGMGGWQERCIVDTSQRGVLQKVDARIPLAAHLGAAGMPGVTAWYGLEKIIAPKPGDTILVSSAAGAVGSVVGQLAKRRGCRVVGVAGGPDKCSYVERELGFDVCIDYKQHDNVASLSRAFKDAAPKGIDGYFENVGGMLLDAALLRMNAFGRIAVCGMIAGYNGEPVPLQNPQMILISRLALRGFIVTEHLEVWPTALAELRDLVARGELKYRESIAHGLEQAPSAFVGMLKGKNLGKQLVKLV